MAIDFKSLFSSNVFTRAQVDLLKRLSSLLLVEAGVPIVTPPPPTPVPDDNGLSGVYTPNITLVNNVAAAASSPSMWHRHGQDVTVYLHFQIDPTTGSTGAEVEFDLPHDPTYDFNNDYDLLGPAYSGTTGTGGHFIAKKAARKARLLMNFETDVANHTWAGTFMYRTKPSVPGDGNDLLMEDNLTQITLEDGSTVIQL